MIAGRQIIQPIGPASADAAGTMSSAQFAIVAALPTPSSILTSALIDAAGGVASVAALDAHMSATGTAVHGLGSASVHAAADFDAVGTAASAVGTHAAMTSTHGVAGAIVGTTDAQTLTGKTLGDTYLATVATDTTFKATDVLGFYSSSLVVIAGADCAFTSSPVAIAAAGGVWLRGGNQTKDGLYWGLPAGVGGDLWLSGGQSAAVSSGVGGITKIMASDLAGSTMIQVGREGYYGGEKYLGFFNAVPVSRPTGGAKTAASTYSTNEQTMLQTLWNAMRSLGLIT